MRQYDFSMVGDLEFVASVGKVNPAQFDEMTDALAEYGLIERGYKRLMFCPLTSSSDTVDRLKSLTETYDIEVSCDSGGYESQINDEYTMQDIYTFDRDYYTANDWPTEYVLPDQVPLVGDDEQTIEHKVRDTISLSRMLYQELPESKRSRTIPVIQGHTKQQIVDCLDTYTQLDQIEKVGFGSFSTGGVNDGVNYLTQENVEFLQFVVKEARKHDLKVHAFGVGGPTSIPILYQCGIDSFDSTGWMRSAGYGNVLFPFKSRLNVTHRRDRSGPTVYAEEFNELKDQTDHGCPFCRSFEKLQESRLYRVMHNLLVIRETAEMISDRSPRELLDLMNPQSRYTRLYKRMVAQ